MQVAYNGFTAAEGRTTIARSVTSQENSAGQKLSDLVRTTLDITIAAANPSAMETAYAAAVSAFSSNGNDLTVTLPGGGACSNLSMVSSTSVEGVRVVERPSIDSIRGGAYATFLPFRVVLEAEYAVVGASSMLREFEETITYSGGGPVIGWLKPLRGRPQRQLLRQQDTYRATQSGRAVGYADRPNAPNPLWLGALNRFPDVSSRSPRRRGGNYLDYEITWSYEFESDVPLIGNPNVWL